jgi:hypothetical protein
MRVSATYQGISYQLEEVASGEWRWSFTPPVGVGKTGRVVGGSAWAAVVARRAIEVWRLMNPTATAA